MGCRTLPPSCPSNSIKALARYFGAIARASVQFHPALADPVAAPRYSLRRAKPFCITWEWPLPMGSKHPVLTISQTGRTEGSIAGTRWMARRKSPTMVQPTAAC